MSTVYKENAESACIKTLELLRGRCGETRCLHFKTGISNDESLHQHIVDIAHARLISPKQHIYVCADGDALVLASAISAQASQNIISDLSLLCPILSEESNVRLYELKLHLNTVLMIMEEKRDLLLSAIKTNDIKQQQAKEEKYRTAILDGGIHHIRGDIAARRAEHIQPEIMIIEDDVFSRRMVKVMFKKDYGITERGGAEGALDAYAIAAPNLLFLDINLPYVNGHELLEKIITFDPQAYVVMLSGHTDKENVTRAIGSGAAGFVGKPFTRQKLLEYINRCPTIS